MNFYVVTGFFIKSPSNISNGDKNLNFELLAVSFYMGPTIMFCLKVVSSKPQKITFNCRSHAKGDSQKIKIEEIVRILRKILSTWV